MGRYIAAKGFLGPLLLGSLDVRIKSNGNKGIGCGLNAVQKIEDGTPLTVRVSAEEAFGGANAYSGAGMPQSMYGVPGQPAAAPPAYQVPGYPQQPAYTAPPLGAPASYGAQQGAVHCR